MLDKLNSRNFFGLFKHKSLQNFIFLLIIQSSNVLIALISIPLLIQAVGVDQFGLISLALAVVFLANVAVTYGYNLSGPREIAINQGNKEALSAVASKVFFSKALLAIMAGTILTALIFGFNFFTEYKEILFFSLLLLFSEATAPAWFFQGLEQMKLASIANVLGKALYLMALVMFVTRPEDAKWANFYLGGTALGMNVLLLFFIHYELKIKIILPKLREVLGSLKENFVLFLSGLASHISVHGGIIILSFFASAGLLGMYSLAERIIMVLRMVPTLITQAVYPNASKLYQTDLPAFFQFMRKFFWTSLGVSLIITVSVLLFAPQIIWLLSKDHFQSSVEFLRILAFVPFFATFNVVNMILILVSDQKSTLFHSTWILGAYMIVAAVVLSYFFGGKGLAYSLLSTELITFGVCSVLIHKKNPEVFNGFYRRALGSHYPR